MNYCVICGQYRKPMTSLGILLICDQYQLWNYRSPHQLFDTHARGWCRSPQWQIAYIVDSTSKDFELVYSKIKQKSWFDNCSVICHIRHAVVDMFWHSFNAALFSNHYTAKSKISMIQYAHNYVCLTKKWKQKNL